MVMVLALLLVLSCGVKETKRDYPSPYLKESLSEVIIPAKEGGER